MSVENFDVPVALQLRLDIVENIALGVVFGILVVALLAGYALFLTWLTGDND